MFLLDRCFAFLIGFSHFIYTDQMLFICRLNVAFPPFLSRVSIIFALSVHYPPDYRQKGGVL